MITAQAPITAVADKSDFLDETCRRLLAASVTDRRRSPRFAQAQRETNAAVAEPQVQRQYMLYARDAGPSIAHTSVAYPASGGPLPSSKRMPCIRRQQ